MTSTATKIISKIDDFSVAVSISELSGLTTGLLQLQHAKYPHLVPMYRTVHRTKPRELVLRAIRWVNPKRMFPGAGETKEEMAGYSREKLEELIVKLNDYRGEALVIHNRYDQMLDMINMGELPYYIPYAGFKQDKWTMLQEYKDRAERLKDGTKEWELVLDRQALDIRSLLKQKHDAKIDDIAGLWVDAKGNAAAPNFMDIKKGIAQKQPLRRTRHGKLIDPPKVYARRYMAVPEAERRRGEEIRMPAGGQVRRPGRNDPVGRKVFDEHGAAAGHLVRVPKGPFLGTDRGSLRRKGQLMSMPAGRGHPMIITFSEVSDDQVANRRLARWTQPDPLKRRGQARHRGEASRGVHGSVPIDPKVDPVPHEAEPQRQFPRPDVQGRQGQVEQRRQQRLAQQQQQQAPPAVPVKSRQMNEAIQINEIFNEASVKLLDKYGIDQSHFQSMKQIKAADVDALERIGGGWNANTGTVIRMDLKNGAKYVYKLVANEQKSEQIVSVIDKIFGLNVNVDTIQFNSINADELKAIGVSSSRDVLQGALDLGGGHLQEFCKPNCEQADDANDDRAQSLYANEEYRGDLHRMFVSDWLSGNWDRHTGNWMVTDGDRAVQIDTGFGFGFADTSGQVKDIPSRGTLFHRSGRGGADARRQHVQYQNRVPGGVQILKQELEAVFDQHVSTEKIDDLQQAFGMNNRLAVGGIAPSIEEYKKNFMETAGNIWGLNFS